MATIFGVAGPYQVPVYQGKAARTITDDNAKEFWKKNPDLASKKGAYVFGVRAGKGSTPAYVGRATKSFRQEVFAPHKLTKYQQSLADYQKGTPILFFLAVPKKKGATNTAHIKALENFLIQTGLAANPDLLNVKGTRTEEWGIGGVIRGGKGKPSKAARQFKTFMKIG